ncbi:MAG: putative lipid II flippase FtsW [Planctomycetes bacterium]|nr:putative lipid II flippase FtsW [Planctomycetota bacterium]
MEKRRLFHLLVSIVIALVTLGIVMVFSASYYQRGVEGDAFFFLKRHLLWVPIALLTGMLVYQFDYRELARWHWLLLLATLALLVLVLIPGVGLNLNKSRRWLPLGSLQFQPSELAKLTAMVFIAGFFSRDFSRLKRFWAGYLPATGGLLACFLLILVEPDFGTAMFVLGLSIILLFISGLRKLYLLGSVFLFSPLIAAFLCWRWEMVQHRLLGFLDPEKVHQVRHSILALGSGGWFGTGLGAGTQKLQYLPEPYTDFIFSIAGEELGFVGTVSVVALFVALLWLSVEIARRARDYFGFLLASGIAISLALQAIINIAVVTATAPTKGIPLPFMTFGGSGLCMTLAEIGLLLSIERVRHQEGPLPDASGAAAE